jgi:DNA primase
MEKANDYYQRQLREHSQKNIPINYLKDRGLSGHIAKEFGIGYAPSGWDNLLAEIGTSNEYQDQLLEGGMLIFNEEKDRLYDRFRERIMFPIRDSRGRVIGFGGRVLNNDKPKYLNSPETPIFHKGKELYGLYEARQAYRQLPRVLVVEGYMDVVALAQYGIRYGVATLGTACSEEHLSRAFRHTNEIVFCFDGDEAGRKAARRAMEHALPVMEDGRQIKFLYLPEGEDPDTLIRQIGEEKFTRLIEGASPLETFLFEELGQHFNTQTMEGRARLCKLAAPMLDQLPRGVYRELMFAQLANRSQLSMDALMTLLNELPTLESPREIIAGANNLIFPTKNTYAKNKGHEHTYSGGKPSSTVALSSDKALQPLSSRLKTAELALALLLFQPSIAQAVTNYEDLHHSQENNIRLLTELIHLLQQRPEFTSGQILGHWQGTYGAEATKTLQQLISKASLFQRASELSHHEENHHFNPEQEFIDTLEYLSQQQRQKDCETIIQQLNQKPPKEWSDAEKQLYLKAINSRAT